MKTWTKQAEAIKMAREKAGISQKKLAKILGYKNGQLISNVERGLCGVPDHRVIAFCDALNYPRASLWAKMCEDYRISLMWQFWPEITRATLREEDQNHEAAI